MLCVACERDVFLKRRFPTEASSVSVVKCDGTVWSYLEGEAGTTVCTAVMFVLVPQVGERTAPRPPLCGRAQVSDTLPFPPAPRTHRTGAFASACIPLKFEHKLSDTLHPPTATIRTEQSRGLTAPIDYSLYEYRSRFYIFA